MFGKSAVARKEGKKMGGRKGGRRKQTHILYLSTAIAQMNFKLSTAHKATDQTANLPRSFHQRESQG